MEFEKVLKIRRSIRAFKGKEIEEAKIKKILEAANSAPSAGNLQAYKIILVKSQEKKFALAKAAFGQSFISEAPIVLVFLADPTRSEIKYGERGKKLYCICDTALAAYSAWLSAANLDLGACWVGAFDDNKVKEILSVDTDLIPVCILPIGYKAEEGFKTSRRNLKELVSKIL